MDAGSTPASKTSENSVSSRRARASAWSWETMSTLCTSGNDWMSPAAAAIAWASVPSATKARISTRSSTCCSAARMLSATRPNSPNANSENAIVVMLSALSSGARPNAAEASRTVRLTRRAPASRPSRRRSGRG